MSMEIMTVLVLGPACVLAAYGTWARRPWRHLATVIISVCELYGGAMTFFPEWVSLSDYCGNLNTESPLYLYVYLWFMNGLWVLLPLVFLFDSSARIIRACDVAKVEAHDAPLISSTHYVVCAVALALYVVLVPLIVGTLS